ncbi:MAG: aminotransferase class I/II-fold pyridoxal phosphate-dependent enzyme [Alphaproteobacteria bacterium]
MPDSTSLVPSTEETIFEGDLSAPDPIPETGIEAAVRLMRDGRLFRYGEDRNSAPEAAALEEEFAQYAGRKYCLGVNSGGCSLFIALKAVGVETGDKVLMNAFTLAPVPGAVVHAGAEAVFIDIDDNYRIDIEDLDRKAAASDARVLMLSYMRGHIPDMDAVMAVCTRRGLIVIEDCAHTMGAGWNGRLTGTFGAVGCFSTQTFKHINSGEGGLIVTDDDDIAARAVLYSGSYMLYAQHRARPPLEAFERHRYNTPNCSMRMSGLVATILRSQLPVLDERNKRWREIYDSLEPLIDNIDHLGMPKRPKKEEFVPSSLQFSVEDLSDERIKAFLDYADDHGVHVKWFGNPEPIGFTSRHDHWRYLAGHNSTDVPNADRVLHGLCDIRLPVWLTAADCKAIATVLGEAMDKAARR